MAFKVDNKTFSDLLYWLYGAATTSDTNKYFLTRLKAELNLQHATLITRPPSTNDSGLLHTSGEEADIAVFGNHTDAGYTALYTQDPLVNLPLNKVITLDELTSRQELIERDYYKLILEPLGIYHVAGIDWLYQKKGEKADNSRMSIRFFRTKEQGEFTAEEKAFLELFIPHLEQSVALGIQLRSLSSERQIYADSISKRSIGMITLDRSGQILKMNNTARNYLSEGDGISLSKNVLKLDNSKLDEKLNSYITEGLALLSESFDQNFIQNRVPINALTVQRPSGKAGYEIVIKPLPVDAKDVSGETAYLAIFIQDPSKNLEISVRTLMKLYQLTFSEATIAILLSEGHTTDEVADELEIKKNTVRAHLRSMFVKTGVSQQSMLVSLVLTSLASTQ